MPGRLTHARVIWPGWRLAIALGVTFLSARLIRLALWAITRAARFVAAGVKISDVSG